MTSTVETRFAGAAPEHRHEPRDYRLDCAKALATSLVLVWHLQPFVLLEPGGGSLLGNTAAVLLAVFNYQVCLLAVPLFFLVSLHLLHTKINERPHDAAARRIRRVGAVYLFWMACQFAIFYGIAAVRLLANGTSSFSAGMPPHLLLMLGGPDLPIIGRSVLYFLFVLLVLVALSSAFQSSKRPGVMRGIGAALVLASVAYFEYVNLLGDGLPYWRVDNFILYAPLSLLLFRQSRENLRRIAAAGGSGYVLFSLQDVYLRSQGQSCGAYSRVSIVCGAVALFCFFRQAGELPKSSAVVFLSRYSLGIFATHKYWQLVVTAGFIFAGSQTPIRAGFLPLNLRSLGIAALAAALTLVAVAIGGQTRIRKFVR